MSVEPQDGPRMVDCKPQVETFRNVAIPLLKAAQHHLRIVLALEADTLDDIELLGAIEGLDFCKAVAFEAVANYVQVSDCEESA